ncbi:hypothetical protein [Sinorhizobium fredii]|uniref:hypothetical protein n=1 Tax=Rhizobium fredii TaxID=380 RepID=UPI00210D5254|nr:hypothetical protein [Sinorhizobium fredii]UTY46699.1 hypothetical protein EPK84_07495 [Sinorhizobium fredii]
MAQVLAAANGFMVADFRNADGYRHNYEKSYGSRWAMGFLCVPSFHVEDQYLISTGAFDIRIPARSRHIVLRYAGRYEMAVPIEFDTGLSLFCGYPGSCLRAWFAGEKVDDIQTEMHLWPKTQAMICAHENGGRPWRGLLADLVIYDFFEPAVNQEIPRIWDTYTNLLWH